MSHPARPVPRVPLLDAAAALAAAEEAGVPAPMAELNVFRVLLQRPRLARAVNDLLITLLFHGELAIRLRELVIMRIGWATRADYEWTQHWHLALERFGLTREELLGVRDWRAADCFDEADRAALAATDDTLETGSVSPATWASCVAHLPSDAARLELVAAIGTWRMISQLLRSLEIPLEEGTASWPPDGTSPA